MSGCTSSSRRRRRYLAADRRTLIIAGTFAAAVFVLSWYRYASFRSTTLDLAVFEQALWKMAHGRAPEVTVIGWNIFDDHLSPVLLLFVPLYRLVATPVWLYAAQALALGLGYLALRPALDEMGVTDRLRTPFAIVYLASPLLWNAALFDFHATTLAVPVLLVGITAALRNDRWMLVCSALALVFLRDDLGAAVAAVALCGITRVHLRSSLILRAVLVLGGLAWVAAGNAVYAAWGVTRWSFMYGHIATSPAAAADAPMRTLVRVAESIWRMDNLALALALLVSVGLLPLLRPARLALAVALALPLLVSRHATFQSPYFHYGAALFPFLLFAAATGVERLPTRFRTAHAAFWVTVMALASLWTIGPPETGSLVRPTVNPADVRHALEQIQPGDRVVATDALGAYLAHRDVLIGFPYPFAEGSADNFMADKARRVSAEAAAEVDVVVVDIPRTPGGRSDYDIVWTSPYFTDFRLTQRFGDIEIYRPAGRPSR